MYTQINLIYSIPKNQIVLILNVQQNKKTCRAIFSILELLVFNATFNISVITWVLVLLVMNTTDLSQAIDKKHNVKLQQVHFLTVWYLTHNFKW